MCIREIVFSLENAEAKLKEMEEKIMENRPVRK